MPIRKLNRKKAGVKTRISIKPMRKKRNQSKLWRTNFLKMKKSKNQIIKAINQKVQEANRIIVVRKNRINPKATSLRKKIEFSLEKRRKERDKISCK